MLSQRERNALNKANEINSILSQSSIAEATTQAMQRAQEQRALRLQQQRDEDTRHQIMLAQALKGGGPFQGTSMEAQSLNALWRQAEALGISQDEFMSQVAAQRMGRPTTISTPAGTHTQPGMDLSFMGIEQSTPGFTPKKRTEGEKRGAYTVENMYALEDQATRYIPGGVEGFANEFLPSSLSGYFASDEYKAIQPVADEWARTLVFLRSGATARQEEVDAAVRNFWARPGDGPKDVERKAKARREAMRTAAEAYYRREGRPGDKYLK